MVNPFSGWVLGGAALLSSPAWHAALVTGTLPVETAAVRFGIAFVVVWVGLSMLSSLVQGTSPTPPPSETVPHSLPGVDPPSTP
ncbi:MAG TPA: hypothetical protein VFG72_08365 [Marmoricola sp.]|nr:hypothetical protein [Marmoricola sp.]